MEKICPTCGVSSGKRKFVGNFCLDCHLKTVRIEIPSRIKIQICKSCGKIKSGKWQEKTDELLGKIIAREAKGKFDAVKVSKIEGNRYLASFLVEIDSTPFEIKREFEIVFDKALCENCSREVSGYYEAIVQLRGDKSRVEKFAGKLERILTKETFISKIIESRNGIDIYAGSKQAVAAALNYLNCKPNISDKLYGVKDGKRIFRRTYCIRL
jgi:nonsense-mediated mRNA decay protein 3